MSEWRSTTLGELCREAGGSIQTGPFGSQLHARDYVTEGVPSVMPMNIGDNRILEEGIARVSAKDALRLKRHQLAPGDIVYSRRGDVERRSLVRQENNGWLCGTGCLRVRVGDPTVHDATFISWALGLPDVRRWIVQHAVGATMLNLNTGILAAVPLLVPPVREQRAIADVLGALDDKTAANANAQRLIVDLCDGIFAAASLSAGHASTFAEVADVAGGGTPKTAVEDFWHGDIRWATPTDVTALQSPYLSETSRTISEAGLESCASRLYPKGSILMTSRATIGAFAIAQHATAVNQGFIVVNANDPDLQWWLFHDMRRRVPEFLSHANGATFLELSRGKFKQLSISLPADDTAAAFSATVGPLHAKNAQLASENRRLTTTRDALLPLLMSGKLRVKDAEQVVSDAGV
ncbi:MAG TPA: restriction endonuclease subunit S [Nocardioides sp.]